MAAYDIHHKKQRDGIQEFKSKKIQCQADKIELMRDLATYEVNFSQDRGRGSFKSKMSAAVKNLSDARNKLSQNVAFDEEGEVYFTDKKVEEQEDGMLIEKSEDSEV